jgi:hypothetical protein
VVTESRCDHEKALENTSQPTAGFAGSDKYTRVATAASLGFTCELVLVSSSLKKKITVAQKIVAQIAKQKYAPPGGDPYFVAELALLNADGEEFGGSPRRFPEFKAVADLLRRETGITHEALQNAFVVYESGKTSKLPLSLEDDQIRNLGFRL